MVDRVVLVAVVVSVVTRVVVVSILFVRRIVFGFPSGRLFHTCLVKCRPSCVLFLCLLKIIGYQCFRFTEQIGICG